MRVRLSTSPHIRHPAVLQRDFQPSTGVTYTFAPVGLLSLAAVLRDSAPSVVCEIYDLNRRIAGGAFPLHSGFYEAVAAEVAEGAPDVVGFMTECDSYHHVLQVAIALRARLPRCAIVLGGPHASAVARRTLREIPAVDAIVIGEGEATFPELLGVLQEPERRAVRGALVRARTGSEEVLDGGSRTLVKSLDDLPVPAYDLYPGSPEEEVFVEVGRGCPFSCEFCSTAPYWSRQHRVKSPLRVLEEVRLVGSLYGSSRCHFTHDLLTTDRAWVAALCDALIAAGVPVRWTCSARTDTVDRALLEHMAKAGCYAIYFGLESGSVRILQQIRKNIPLAHSFDVLRQCSEAGIRPNVGFIAGFPGEDSKSLEETLGAYEAALRAGCRPAHVFGYCPFAGSSLYAKIDAMRCTGHFLDLPLGTTTDLRNRQIVGSDRELYGSYYRPELPELVPGDAEAVFAIDEFSPLVEATLVPALALAETLGGMYRLFAAWISWIREENDRRGAAAYRNGYGSPLDFARFLEAELRSRDAGAAICAAASVVSTNLRIVAGAVQGTSMTMASHRSVSLPTLSTTDLSLSTPLEVGEILATLAVDYDVTPVLMGEVTFSAQPDPTFLVWHRGEGSAVRLLRVSKFVFESIRLLSRRSETVGTLLFEEVVRNGRAADGAAREARFQDLVSSIQCAADQGLVRIGG